MTPAYVSGKLSAATLPPLDAAIVWIISMFESKTELTEKYLRRSKLDRIKNLAIGGAAGGIAAYVFSEQIQGILDFIGTHATGENFGRLLTAGIATAMLVGFAGGVVASWKAARFRGLGIYAACLASGCAFWYFCAIGHLLVAMLSGLAPIIVMMALGAFEKKDAQGSDTPPPQT